MDLSRITLCFCSVLVGVSHLLNKGHATPPLLGRAFGGTSNELVLGVVFACDARDHLSWVVGTNVAKDEDFTLSYAMRSDLHFWLVRFLARTGQKVFT
jgi:hypothetical protein